MSSNQKIVKVGSEGKAWEWGSSIFELLLKRGFPNCDFELSKTDFSFYLRSHFLALEPEIDDPEVDNLKIPYISWSGEPYRVTSKSYPPILNIVSDGEEGFHIENGIPTMNIPYLVMSFIIFESRGYLYPHYKNGNRPHLLAYCNSNSVQYREDFFKMARDKIGQRAHGLGKCSNTQGLTEGSWVSEDLIKVYSQYNFVMAFENCQKLGYITEKILLPFIAGAIPVYWGDDHIATRIFNPEAFIRVSDFSSIEDCIDYLIELDKDEDKLNEIRQQPIFKDNKIHDVLRITDPTNSYYDDVANYLKNVLGGLDESKVVKNESKVVKKEPKRQIKSYSQLNQDLHMVDFFNHREGLFFLDVGAHDGISLSNSYLLEKEYGWDGICCEPGAEAFENLSKIRDVTCVNKAIFSESGLSLEFSNAGQLSGITDFIDHHESAKQGEKTYVETLTLQDLLDEYRAPRLIHYFSLDTEGTEYEILKSVDFTQYRFGYINIEHNYIEPRRTQIRDFLTRNGYIFKGPNQWDDDYIHQSLVEGTYYFNENYDKPITIECIGENRVTVRSDYWSSDVGVFSPNSLTFNWDVLGTGKLYFDKIVFNNNEDNVWHRDRR